MKILYGVTGEGMGHAMRSRVLIDHLVSCGHDVAVVASGRAYAFLRARFPDVRAIHGLHMIFDGNRLDLPRTLLSNALGGLRGIPTNVAAHVDLLERFRPEVVISDFDSWSWLYGMMHRLPILSVDNMQLLDRCELPDALKEGSWAEFHMTRAFVKSKLPGCDRYFVTRRSTSDQEAADAALSAHPPAGDPRGAIAAGHPPPGLSTGGGPSRAARLAPASRHRVPRLRARGHHGAPGEWECS